MQNKITLYGRIPSKKNSTWGKVITGKNGKPRQIKLPSKEYAKWEGEQGEKLIGMKSVEGDIYQVSMDFFMPCNRRADLTNKAESIMDLLVKCRVIQDDSWQHIPQILLNCEGIDRENPRVEIEIKCR